MRRLIGYWALTAVLYLLSGLLLWLEVWLGIVPMGAAQGLTVGLLGGLILFYFLIRTSSRSGLTPSQLASGQAVHAIACIIIGYVIAVPVRGATLLLLIVVLVFTAFALSPRKSLELTCTAIAMLGLTMLWLVATDPQRHTPQDEAVHFIHAASMLLAVSFLTGRLNHLRQLQKELIWRQANCDPLTGLANRRVFNERLEEEMQRTQRTGLSLAVIFLDLDHFKEVNDTLGHGAGDRLLQDCARRLRSCVRETDCVARLGGDEFIMAIGGVREIQGLHRIAEEILHKLSEPFQLGGESAFVSTSIGITLYPADAASAEELLRNADQAVYAAKHGGRNQCQFFTQSMQEAAQVRMRTATDLRSALPGHQFQVVYQPIVELSTGRIRKAEALIRWHHPVRGFISPAEFIPIAEQTGMIREIGDWIFREASTQAKRLRDTHDRMFQISVNKSPIQFRHSCESWFEHLDEIGLDGDGVVIEITEGLLLDAGSSVVERLTALRERGIQISLDDFGTGYSSLSHLQKLDIDYLKIDQVFVRNLATNISDLELCKSMIAMAHVLGLKVIAEGIETPQQCALLAAAGCDFGQGYLFLKPVPADEFEAYLETRKTSISATPQRRSATALARPVADAVPQGR